MHYQNFLDLNKMFNENPQYLRDTVRRSIMSSTFTGEWRKDPEDYYAADFMFPDSKNEFDKNFLDPVTKEKLLHGGWADEEGNVKTKIEYKINSHGFRSKHFDEIDRPIVCFGCSFTYGVGLPEEYTWPDMVSKHFDIPAYNLGVPGMGLDIASIYATNWLVDEIWRPRAICVLLPPPGRIDFFAPQETHMPPPTNYRLVNLWHDVEHNEDRPNKTTKQLVESIPFTSYLMQRRNVQTLKLLANYLSIPFAYADTIYTDIHPSDQNILNSEPLARDLKHAGVDWQKRVANHIIQQLDSYPDSNWKEYGDLLPYSKI